MPASSASTRVSTFGALSATTFARHCAMVDSDQPFETLAHLDYPKRYWVEGAAPYREADLRGRDPRHPQVSRAQRQGARGQHDARRATLCPDITVVRWWHELGGQAVSFGAMRTSPDKVAMGFQAGDADGAGGRVQARERSDGALAPVILRPTSPAHGGASIARDDEGRVWLVNYALPGEVVEAEPRGKQGGVAVAATTRVIESSPNRVEPRCPYFGACGGCQWQHASYPLQLELKRQVVEEAWARAGLRLPPDTPVLGMDDPWRYRIRGEFEAVPTGEGWRFGFHRLRSHAVLPIASCDIHDLRIEQALPAFAQAARRAASDQPAEPPAHHRAGWQGLVVAAAFQGQGAGMAARRVRAEGGGAAARPGAAGRRDEPARSGT